MSVWILISGACILVSVKTHPLVQTIQPYPITNCQQHVYRSPYSEAFILQPSNVNDYFQPPSVQIPVSTYQNLQTPTLTEQIIQLYWDKLISNPSLSEMLVPNKIVHDRFGNEKHTNPQSYDSGGLVNNYIIIPSDYLTINDTVSKQNETKKGRKKTRKPVKEHDTSRQKRKKVLTNIKDNVDDFKLSNFKTQRRIKQNVENSWNFNTDNIKCFTPADILKSEKYQPEKKVNRNKVKNKCYREKHIKKPKSSVACEKKDRIQKCKKTQKNNINDTKNKKTKQSKKGSNMCKCIKKGELPECEPKISEKNSQYCNQDINDVLLSTLVQQECTKLENRHTRNSNADIAVKDIRSMYPDLPNDLSKTLTWYMNDLFSPHSLQQGFTSNAFLGNNYPFDFSQIYQVPTFSNAKVNNPKGNTEKNLNTRRKKKKKKNSKARTKENASGDNNDHSEISEKNIQIPETSAQITDTSLISNEFLEKNSHDLIPNIQISETKNHDSNITNQINITFSEKNNHISSNKVPSIINETKPIEFTTVDSKIINKETVGFNPMTSSEKVLENKKNEKEVLDDKKIQKSDQNLESEEEDFNESYETQIPISVEINNEVPKDETSEFDDMLLSLHPNNYNQFQELESEDEILKMFMNDYYPDFRAYNQAYVVSDEEADVRNIHDRYFYVTDRNIDTKEYFLPDEENQLSKKESIYSEGGLGNYNILDHNDSKNTVKKEEKSQEIVFRTPPGLDAPDFITRKINRDSHDSTEFYYQHDNFEDNLDRFNLNYFADDSDKLIQGPERTSDNNSGRLVETVYARSKVVKYGQGQEVNKSSKPDIKTNFPKLQNGATHNDGKTTVVVAKSVRPEEYHY